MDKKPTKTAEDFIRELMRVADQPVQAIEFNPNELTLEIDPSELEIDFDAPAPARKQPPPAPPTEHSVRTSIRFPGAVLDAFQLEAKRRGIKYQTLIIRELRNIAKGWP